MTTPLERLGTSLADRYRVERELGRGGMATVYLAHDLKHDRDVALKVLRPDLAAVIGADRFLAEIRTTASLQHPNILPLFDSGAEDGQLFYVMPFVEGETLRERIAREKQLPIGDAIQITREVAAALDYAHRQGVIHRDIKPENVLLKDGHALVADFGIALAVSAAGASRLTETGISLGTPHYMSPEQAAGDRELTPRADIYSLAAMLYEMLAGDPPFQGSTAQAIFAKVLTERPPLVTQARDTVPRQVALAVHQGLARLPADRPPTAHAFAEALVRPGLVPADAPLPELEGAPRRRSRLARYVAAVVVLASVALAAWGWWRTPAVPRVVRIPVAFSSYQQIAIWPGPAIAFSRDGARLAYVGPAHPGNQLWIWSLDKLGSDSIPGTLQGLDPAFSPDGSALAFYRDRAINVVSLLGGTPQTITDSATLMGTAWGPDGYVYYQRAAVPSGLSRVRATGGSPEVVTVVNTAAGETEHRWPAVLPNGRAVVFTVWSGGLDQAQIAVVNLRTKAVHILVKGASAHYAPTGHLVFTRSDGTLAAVPFDADRLAVTGPPTTVLDRVNVKIGGASDFTIGNDGSLAYVTGDAPSEELVWVGRDGVEHTVDSTLHQYFTSFSLSPDGARLAVSFNGATGSSLWGYDFAARTLSRLTFDGTINERPEWSGDGRWILYSSDRSGAIALWRIPRDGGRAPERVAPQEKAEVREVAESRDGRWLVYRRGPGRVGDRELMMMQPGVDSVARRILPESGVVFAPALSPDGHWLAYVSDISGRSEVYVRPFPTGDGQWQVSTGGGAEPHWNPASNELLYRSGRREMVAATYVVHPTFAVTAHRVLFSDVPYVGDFTHHFYDISPDGQRLLLAKTVRGATPNLESGSSAQQLVVVLNWFQDLRGAVRR